MNKVDAQKAAVSFENVTFQYPGADRPSVTNINLEIKSGEFVVFTGGSGCGKTTLTRIINGLAEKFYEGDLTGKAALFGRSISDYPLYEVGKIVGSIFQDPKSQFFASITEDEIAFGCENYGVSFAELNDRVLRSARKINGDALLGKQIYPMSSGEKQKIAVASVNAVNPQIYVFDEPSANLDMFSIEALKKLMQELKAEGHTVLVAEHRLYYLAELADRFFYVKNGRIKTEWPAPKILSLSETERRDIGIRATNLSNIRMNSSVRKKEKETLSVEGLSFSYHKKPILEEISFKVYAGDVVAVIGHNGVGKTTLSNILCGIQKEKSGKILFNGKKVAPKKRKQAAYFVMQNTDCQLFGDSVVEELRLNRKHADESQLEELLKLYDLFDWKDCHPATLSGGQKQRLTLAVSDLIDTPVLILDEPTSGLDFRNMQRISNHLKSLTQKGKSVLVITHDFEFAAMTCNRAIHFRDGQHIDEFSLQGNLSKLHDCLMKQ
ncbi:MAG: energy-coupling factor ABC transporter ATP-binding protein [Lachnospiraceae bacterium]